MIPKRSGPNYGSQALANKLSWQIAFIAPNTPYEMLRMPDFSQVEETMRKLIDKLEEDRQQKLEMEEKIAKLEAQLTIALTNARS